MFHHINRTQQPCSPSTQTKYPHSFSTTSIYCTHFSIYCLQKKYHSGLGSPSKSTLLWTATAVKHQLQNYAKTTEDEWNISKHLSIKILLHYISIEERGLKTVQYQALPSDSQAFVPNLKVGIQQPDLGEGKMLVRK